MKAILLLGANFVRSQFLVLAIVVAYVVCLTSFLAFHEQLPDLLFFIRQQAIYGFALGAMVIVPAIHNERKSRRILSVLSKGIHRWQYLGGLLCGAIMITSAFCLEVGLSASWLAHETSMPATGLVPLMLMLFFACSAGVSTALFCSVFLHPLLAFPATAMLLLFPLAAEGNGLHLPKYFSFSPVTAALREVFRFTFQRPVNGLWVIAITSLIQIVVFWLGACILFARRDVTVAAE
jgi:hypothetical protein